MLRVLNMKGESVQTAERPTLKPLRIARHVRFTGFLLGVAVLFIAPLDTAFGLFDRLYANGAVPRTHPLTWACLLLAVMATLRQRPLRHAGRIERGLWLTVLVIAIVKPWASAAIDNIARDVQLGAMGWNTATAFAFIALGQLLRKSNTVLGLFCAIGGVFLPGVALNGLLLGNSGFYGEMAAPTAFAVFGLGLANILSYARRPGLRLILKDSAAGRLVRHQVLLWAGLACLTPPALRLTDLTEGSGFALLYTAQMACILAGILHFGLRFAGLLDNARRLERDLVRDVSTDPLTGAATRRAAVSYFVKTVWRQPMGVIMIDLDHFKRVNDLHGHAAGDQVLKTVVRGLRKDLRLTDMLARWGGEELLILIPAQDLETLRTRAEALRARIQSATAADASIPTVTASFGVTIAKPDMEPDMAAALERADAALYDAKAEGRNRVVVYDGQYMQGAVAEAA